jgi:hypothetical protein
MIEVYGPYLDLQFPFFNWEKKIAEKHPGETMDYDRVLISYDTPVAAYLAHSQSIPGGGVFVQQEGQAASQKTRRHINKWVKTLGEYYSSLSLHNGVDPWWNPATEEQIQAILDDLFDMGPPGMGLREHINEWGRHYFEVEL